MGARRRSHGSRDREQRNALITIFFKCRGSGARRRHYRLPRRFWSVHRVDLNKVQIEASRGYELLSSREIFLSASANFSNST